MADLGFQIKLLVSEYMLITQLYWLSIKCEFFSLKPSEVKCEFFSLKPSRGDNAVSCFHFNVFIYLFSFALCQHWRYIVTLSLVKEAD